jgi:hypothetical protein
MTLRAHRGASGPPGSAGNQQTEPGIGSSGALNRGARARAGSTIGTNDVEGVTATMQTIGQTIGQVQQAARELRAAGLQVTEYTIEGWLSLPERERREWLPERSKFAARPVTLPPPVALANREVSGLKSEA